jgi:hypothetical protein
MRIKIGFLALALVVISAVLARAELVITDKMVGLVMQCGQAIITIGPDKKLHATGLPDGTFPLDVKDGVIYIDGKPCKPVCKAPAEQRC